MSMIESAVLVVNETVRYAHVVTLLPLSVLEVTMEGNSTLSRRVPSFFRISYEAGAYLAFRHFQERNPIIVKELATLDCDLQFTYETFDDELSPIVASRHLQQVVTRSDKIPVALVGAARSSVSVALGTLSGVYQIPQVSVTSTATVLDDKNLFPYFGRMIPTNAGDATAMAIYFQSIGVSHFGCLFIRDDFGTSFSKDVFLAAEAHGLVVTSIAFEAESTESIKEALQFLKATNLRYFFGIWNEKTYRSVFMEGYRSGIMGNPDYFWLLGEGSLFTDPTRSLDAETEMDLARSISGTGVVQLRIKDNPDITAEMQRFQLDPEFQADFISSHCQENQYLFESIDLNSTPITKTVFQYLAYDAFMGIALAACKQKKRRFTGRDLLETLREQQFQGASGLVKVNNKTGTREPDGLQYTITNVAIDWAKSNSTSIMFQINTGIVVDFPNTLTQTGQAFMYAGNSTIAPPSLPLLQEKLNQIDFGVKIAGLALCGLVILMSMGWSLFTVLYRKVAVIQVSQPVFLWMMCCGTFIMGCSIVPMSLEEPTSISGLNIACMSSLWLLSVGFVTSFASLFSKLYRLNKVMSKAKQCRRVIVRAQDVLYPFFILLTLNVIVLSIWTAVAPLKWTRFPVNNVDIYGRSLESFGKCASHNKTLETTFYMLLFVVNLSAVGFANWQSYIGRKHPSQYNETFHITISMASLFEASILSVPVLFLVQDSPSESFLVRAILVTVMCCAILLPLFIPKFLLRNKKKSEHRLVAFRSSDEGSSRSNFWSASLPFRARIVLQDDSVGSSSNANVLSGVQANISGMEGSTLAMTVEDSPPVIEDSNQMISTARQEVTWSSELPKNHPQQFVEN